jgi:hypothetical protein
MIIASGVFMIPIVDGIKIPIPANLLLQGKGQTYFSLKFKIAYVLYVLHTI